MQIQSKLITGNSIRVDEEGFLIQSSSKHKAVFRQWNLYWFNSVYDWNGVLNRLLKKTVPWDALSNRQAITERRPGRVQAGKLNAH